MAEDVRLVIWDLDETFWNGTLSEGGIVYNSANHDLVIALATRGIVSAICSKNNFEDVKTILTDKGIWDYFVFPSVDWSPKGPRIKALIQDIQLRPESVLLIDDNPSNLREAQHFVPGIQTASIDIIPTIRLSPRFKGKADKALARLNQYRLLQTRKADAIVAGDNQEFLRSCNIRVEIEHDIEANLDRAIELINRTNQLNFTKRRLPEDIEKARAELREDLAHFATQSGLIRVTDRYGDYGYCGFYLMTMRSRRARLRHFCFSCRILNMGVERWLYDRLGRPVLHIRGEVLNDLSNETAVDWINSGMDISRAEPTTVKPARSGLKVFVRGACQSIPLLHYFKMDAEEAVGEFNEVHDGIAARIDHSLVLRHIIEGATRQHAGIFRRLGYDRTDLGSRFASLDASFLRILDFWIDAQAIVYRHRDTGLLIPFDMRGVALNRRQRTALDPDSEEAENLSRRARRALRFIRDEFEPVGVVPEVDHARSLDVIFDAVPNGARMFVLAAPGSEYAGVRFGVLNQRIAAAAARHPNKFITVGISELVGEEHVLGNLHFHRKAYYELYRAICAHLPGSGSTQPTEWSSRIPAAAS